MREHPPKVLLRMTVAENHIIAGIPRAIRATVRPRLDRPLATRLAPVSFLSDIAKECFTLARGRVSFHARLRAINCEYE